MFTVLNTCIYETKWPIILFLPISSVAMVYIYVFGANPWSSAIRKTLTVHILDVNQ